MKGDILEQSSTYSARGLVDEYLNALSLKDQFSGFDDGITTKTDYNNQPIIEDNDYYSKDPIVDIKIPDPIKEDYHLPEPDPIDPIDEIKVPPPDPFEEEYHIPEPDGPKDDPVDPIDEIDIYPPDDPFEEEYHMVEPDEPKDDENTDIIEGEEVIDETEDETSGGGLFSGITGGGGGGAPISFSSGKKVSTGDGGFVQLPKGIQITGYVYPYTFLAITAAGAGLGFLVAKRFKQSTLGLLSLVAAGLMGGSAVGNKIKPPVKVPS